MELRLGKDRALQSWWQGAWSQDIPTGTTPQAWRAVSEYLVIMCCSGDRRAANASLHARCTFAAVTELTRELYMKKVMMTSTSGLSGSPSTSG